jgi:hypothetical protein
MSEALKETDKPILDHIRLVHRLRQGGTPLIGPLLWTMRHPAPATSTNIGGTGKTRQQRLGEFIKICEDRNADAQLLQRAAMEIPYLAAPQDGSSVSALANLLDHENHRVKMNACKALGYIAGEPAKEVLRALEKSSDPPMKDMARRSLESCELIELLTRLEGDVEFGHSAISPQVISQVVYVCAAGGILAFVSTLLAWYRYSVPVVHPVLSVLGLTFCVGLAAAAVWRSKCG